MIRSCYLGGGIFKLPRPEELGSIVNERVFRRKKEMIVAVIVWFEEQ